MVPANFNQNFTKAHQTKLCDIKIITDLYLRDVIASCILWTRNGLGTQYSYSCSSNYDCNSFAITIPKEIS